MKNKKIQNSLIILYCTLCLGYLIFNPMSAPKIRRPEGHKIMTDILDRTELKKGDIILLEYYPQSRFEKYFDFSDYKVISINKGNFADYLSHDTSYNQAYKNGKEIYKNMLIKDENSYFKEKINHEIINELKTGQSVVMVTLDSVSFYSPEKVKKIVTDDSTYNQEPLLFLLFSYIKEQTFSNLAKTLPITRIEQKGNWTVIKFTKLNK